MSDGRSLARSGLIVMFLNGAAIVAAFAREATIAYYYGASAELDAFWVALSVPRFVGESLVVATVTALIPVFAKTRAEEGEEAMVHKASNLASVNLVGLAVFIVGYMIAAPFVIKALAPGFEPYRHNLAVRLTVLVAPITLLWGALGILKALHNTYRRFTYPELARVLLSLGIVAALVVFASRYGIYAMVVGFIGGLGLAMLLSTAPLSRLRKMLRLRLNFRAPEVRRYLAMLLPVLATSGIYYVHVFVDNMFASGLEHGSISALRYATTIAAVPVTLIGTTLSTVLFPVIADLVAHQKKDELRTKLEQGIGFGLFVGLSSLIFLFWFASPIMRILFQRGRFSPEVTRICSTLVVIYSVGSVAAIMSGVVGKVVWAAMKVRAIVVITVMTVVANFCLNAVLVRLWGVFGLAAATAAVSWLRYSLLLLLVRRSVVKVKLTKRVTETKGLLLLIFAFLAMSWAHVLLQNTHIFRIAVLKLLCGLATVAVVYMVFGKLLKVQQVSMVISTLKSFLSRRNQR